MSALKAYVYVNGSVYGPGDEVPSDVADLITNPKAWDGDGPTASNDGDDSADGYARLTKSQLTDLIKDRNEGRADDAKIIPTGGNKPDLIAALEADDQVSAPTGDGDDA